MASSNGALLPATYLNLPVSAALTGTTAEKQIVNTQLNAALKYQLTASATTAGEISLANLLQNLTPGDLATDQNLSLRDFVTKYTTLPTDPVASKAAEAAIATLSPTTTVAALLGLNGTIATNPALSGIAAQTNLATLLSTSATLGTAQLQTDFIAKFTAFAGAPQDFWTQLSHDAEFKAVVPELQLTMHLGVLTLDNAPLVRALRAAYKLSSLRDLKLDAPTLTQIMTSQKIAVPAGVPGATPADQLTNYVNGMVNLLEAAFPTDYVAKGLAASANATLQSVAKVLSNAPDIDLQSTNLDAYLTQNAAKAFQNVSPDQVAAVTSQIKSVQRIFRISSDPSTVTTLLAAGLDSASKIAAISRASFVNQFSSALGGTAPAQTVYAAASHINAQALNFYRTVQGGLKEISLRAIGSPVSSLAQTIQQQIPNWEELFGSTSYCACGECGSVYGAAAYFVDLLQFLDAPNSIVNSAGFSPLDILIGATNGSTTVTGRRPDLPYIKLDCKNTNTPLPYIDLVNEILESYIALGGQLNQSTARNTPSDASADELLVNPEYTIDAAYTALNAATYPLSLPYDRFLDVARRYLAFLGGNRLQVIRLFQTQSAPVDTASVLAAETLGISLAEVELIAGWNFQSGSAATAQPLTALYGVPATVTSGWETWISSVPTFLQQTGLAFADLISLLETQFINPGQTITLAGGASCDLTQTTIASLDDPTLAKILPFLRLWKKLGWSMRDLDKALRVLAPSGIDRNCLLALADLTQLRPLLNLSLPPLMSLWSGIDIDGRHSLYIRLFQNKAVVNPVDTAFRLSYRAALPTEPAATLPPSVAGQAAYDSANKLLSFTGAMTDDQRSDLIAWATGNPAAALAVQNLYEMRWAPGSDIAQPTTITDHVAVILAALRISADDLNAIRIATGLADAATPTPLNLANLSILYRYAIFAQALSLSIPDLISLISLTGINPFQLASANSAVAPAVQFVQAAQAVQSSPFSASQLNYIYRGIANPAAGVGPLNANVDLLVVTLKAGLKKIATANAFTPDPTGKLLRQKLGLILGRAPLAAAMGLIDGTTVYTSSLPALPVLAGTLATQITYDSANQLLKCNGAMTDATEASLAASSTDLPWKTAIEDLYQQPRMVLATDLTFLTAAAAETRLIDSRDPDDRYSWVLQNLLSYLTNLQSRDLVQQTLSQALSLDAATTTLLLSGGSGPASPALLKSQRDATQPAIQDLLDVCGGGLLATYFSDEGLTAVTAVRIDAMVNVGTAGTAVSNPGGARWQAKVLAGFSESYTFTVTANDGVRLWVNDQILIDQWSNQAVSTRTSTPVNLTAGQLYDLRLDYFNASAAATVQLNWSGKSTSNNVNVSIPQSAFFPTNAFSTLFRLYPIGMLLSTFAVQASELAWLSSHGADFAGADPGNPANTAIFDLSALPTDRLNAAAVDRNAVALFNQWVHLNDLFELRNALPSGNVTLFDIFRAASGSANPALPGSATISAVLAATGWDAGEFATLSGKTTAGSAVIGFGLSDADFVNGRGRNGTGLVWLKQCLDLAGRLGVSTSQLFSWANIPPSSSQANDIRNTVKAKYDDATWITVGQPLNNQIRDNSKTALIAYVLNLPAIVRLGITNADRLYEYFLIDVQMTSCMQTSRIVQATAAIQLFVQRCLLSLELKLNPDGTAAANSVGADAIDAAQWEWRKNYRVWEANREVFLYPENWIDPTLRDDRTPFFQDLQAQLQQGEVTADSAEQAFQDYLTKLLEVSRLEICGFYHEVDSDSDATHNIFHVFGRTFASPHIYYYRQLDNITRIWSAWERVDVDIQGDHLIPVIWNRRLYLFWPIFKEHSTPNTAAANGVDVPSAGAKAVRIALPIKSLQIQLAWSENRNGAWTKKQVTADSLTPGLFSAYKGDFDPGTISFQASSAGAGLGVSVYCWGLSGPGVLLDTISFPDRVPSPPPSPPPPPPITYSLYYVGQIAFSGYSAIPAVMPNLTPVPVDQNMQGEPPIPFNTVFDYMNAEENPGVVPPQDSSSVNTLTLTSLISSGVMETPDGMLLPNYTRSPFPVLWTTPQAPPPFTLCYPQQFLPNVQTNAGVPFFYADGSRTFLATQTTSQIAAIFSSPVNSVVPYSTAELNPSFVSLPLTQLPIFEATTAGTGTATGGTKTQPVVAVAQSTTAIAEIVAPLSVSVAKTASAPTATRLVATAATRLQTTVAANPASSDASSVDTTTTTTVAAAPADTATPVSVTGIPKSVTDSVVATNLLNTWRNLVPGLQTPSLTFAIHFHPHASDFLKALNWQGIPGLLTLATQCLDHSDTGTASKFYAIYSPANCVNQPYPSEEVDFSADGAYSLYNWEVFFHIPFLIATQLSRNQQFDDAEKWFRYIFNPSSSTGDIPERYWNVLPLRKAEAGEIGDLITALASGSPEAASYDQQISAWAQTPFDPDVIARMRLVAYKKAMLMRYIDHHLAWGDSLYGQFTRESVNEATLHYVLCQDLLGDKPVMIPPQGLVTDQTYNQLTTTSSGLDSFSDALVALENLFPFSTSAANSTSTDSGASSASSIVTTPYFCIPPNATLLGYWDTVAQRLFQIRHCMNISRQVQTLPLFAPPIDPGQLIRALAMGMDLTSALNDINAATPFYRFAYMLPKALEMCAEVRSLGASLLSALEKSDAEGLSTLRATQETALMKAVRNVKQQQLNEANSNVDALNDSLALTTFRQQHYKGLISAGQSVYETSQVSLLIAAAGLQAIAAASQLFGAQVTTLPTVTVGLTGAGGSPTATATSGGEQIGAASSRTANFLNLLAALSSSGGNIAGIQGGFDRRTQDWNLQLQTATLELNQINDQISAANARIAAAQADLDNQDLQISNSSDVEQFLRTKYTNQALYDWMVGQVSSVYFQCYQMAYDLAKRAEACFVFERMPDLSTYTPFIQFGYWDSLKKGLLSGERLYQDLKRLEIAYMDQNQRDYEITKSISLLLLDPMALINLKETGTCTLQFPEALFDMDYPGHYLRRVKSIGITIPCVVGPYTSVNCTLTLATNKIRFNNMAADPKDYVKDSHYLANLAASESIATSSAQNDSGLFILNFNDERYLPFEGAGAISTWQLSMPLDTNAFDFETISDVIFNLKYTSRDGGSALRGIAKAAANLPAPSAPGATPAAPTALAAQTNLSRMFSLRHEFPSDWQLFLHPLDAAPDQTMTINLTQERFPFQYRGKKIQIYEVDLFLKLRDIYDPIKYTANGTPLGDYGAKPVTLNLTSPSSSTAKTVKLASNPAILAGVPYGTIAQSPLLGGVGAWTLVAKGTDIAGVAPSFRTQATGGTATFDRLAADVVEDLFFVFHFSLG